MGIYGGTFNPPHIGHIVSAFTFYDVLHLDKLLIMPTFVPPHKSSDEDDDPQKRLEMCRLAFEGTKRNIVISDYEVMRGGLSYTYLTLQHFAENNTRLTFLCGTDMFMTLDEWKNPDIIFSCARIALIRRERNSYKGEYEIISKMRDYVNKYGADIVDICSSPYEASSTQVREMFRSGEYEGVPVTDEVRDYIIKNHLYGG